jgi:hypothetical protein
VDQLRDEAGAHRFALGRLHTLRRKIGGAVPDICLLLGTHSRAIAGVHRAKMVLLAEGAVEFDALTRPILWTVIKLALPLFSLLHSPGPPRQLARECGKRVGISKVSLFTY